MAASLLHEVGEFAVGGRPFPPYLPGPSPLGEGRVRGSLHPHQSLQDSRSRLPPPAPHPPARYRVRAPPSPEGEWIQFPPAAGPWPNLSSSPFLAAAARRGRRR